MRLNSGCLKVEAEDDTDLVENQCSCEASLNVSFKVASRRPGIDVWKSEEIGSDSPYRCVECRKCQQCRKGDVLERISFKEEAEQAMIESSIELNAEKKKLRAFLLKKF